MTAGIIQLVAKGVQDLFLTHDPQITFFKIIYRRHTNFSTEPIPQYFNFKPNFSKKSTCIISKSGDSILNMVLVITLPMIQTINSEYKFAWVRKIGFAIIKNITFEIGGHIIDKQYGEWLNIFYELFGPREYGFLNMIGDVPELINLSSCKNEFTLYIPLNFWFSKTYGLALPILCLQYTDVRVILELNDFEKCHIISPTNYIQIYNDLVNFQPYETIEQNINGRVARGIFTNYDIMNKRLYYIKTTDCDFLSIDTCDEFIDDFNGFDNYMDQQNFYYNCKQKYFIKGCDTGYIVMPELCAQQVLLTNPLVSCVDIVNAYILVDYVFLDEEERYRFLNSKIDYLIEQVLYSGEKIIDGPNRQINLDFVNPCKFLVWVCQLDVFSNVHDCFNYTDKFCCRRYFDYLGARVINSGKSLVDSETIILNGQCRLSKREYQYFNYVQPYQYCTYSPSEGINLFSFSLFPNKFQPSGSCNMSQIANIKIDLSINKFISPCVPIKFRCYALTYNILRITNGLAGLVFVDKNY